jgi:hypothetical protein
MALIKKGSLNDFAVKANYKIASSIPELKGITTLAAAGEVRRDLEEKKDTFELITSKDKRGISIKNLMLKKGFEGFLENIFDKDNEIYFVAWAWDFSGVPVEMYPGANFNPNDVLIKLRAGKVTEFMGSGINLFSKRKVKGGIAVRIQIWENDSDVRDAGETMVKLADTIENSKLNTVLSTIGKLGIQAATISLVKDAALELTKVVGKILESNKNDYVDFYEGYFPSDEVWKTGNEKYSQNSSEITLYKS